MLLLSELRNLRLAIGFLTILPVASGYTGNMGRARVYFPIVGLALGGAMTALDFGARQVLPLPVVGALLLVALVVMTRAIHTEGFLDACDGLLGGLSQKRRLEILRDTHVGAFAVTGAVALLLTKWTLLSGVPDGARAGLLAAFPCLSRFGMLSTMEAFRYVRAEGTGTAFQTGTSRWQIVFGLVTAAAAGFLLLGYAGLMMLGAAVAVSLAFGWWASRLLGGMTGDTYGAANEVAEVVVLLLGTALFGLLPVLFDAPLW